MAAVSSLRRWLRRTPQPFRLRVDGQVVNVATGVNQWAVTEDTVVAMQPRVIEALDRGGVVLRAISLERDDEETSATPATTKGERKLVTIARLLNEAHDNGAKRHADAYKLAFEENTKLVKILADRLGGLEESWQEAMQAVAEARAEVVAAQAGNGDEAGAAIASMLGTAAAHQLQNGKANGAKPKGKE